ncbi:HPr family phosphocarrier protein [bacterium]|nr:HPr family phosphocarrier protein [bacterium]MCG2676759.1 HPr family phosphocarrier protein [bacterium]
MQEKRLVIQNRAGLHARPAALFVQTANKFESQIKVAKEDQEVDGKSIMGIMMLAAGKGTRIKITAAGADEKEALERLEELINKKFGEE